MGRVRIIVSIQTREGARHVEVSAIPAADSAAAFAHYSASLAFETDCADVHSAMAHGPNAADFVLLDVRSPALFARGHVPGAVNAARQDRGVEARRLSARDVVRHLLRGPALQRRDAWCDAARATGAGRSRS